MRNNTDISPEIKTKAMTHKTELIIWEGEQEIEMEIVIHYEYSPAEPRTRDYPGCAASVDIWKVTSDDPHFDEERISEETKEQLESEIFNNWING